MKIVLMRHGEAYDASERADRPLTPRGTQDARKLARFLRQTGWTFDEVRCSPVLRATETGRLVATELSLPVKVDARLEPGLEPEKFADSVDGLEGSQARIHVFHMPDIAMVAAHILGGQAERYFFGPGSALGINLSAKRPVTGLQVFHYQPDFFQ